MASKRATKDIAAVIRDRDEIDRAFVLAFHDAVRRHRAAGVPLVMWENDQIVHVDPFDVPLPGENGDGRDDGRGG